MAWRSLTLILVLAALAVPAQASLDLALDTPQGDSLVQASLGGDGVSATAQAPAEGPLTGAVTTTADDLVRTTLTIPLAEGLLEVPLELTPLREPEAEPVAIGPEDEATSTADREPTVEATALGTAHPVEDGDATAFVTLAVGTGLTLHMLGSMLWPGFTRIARDDLLDHPARGRIYEAIGEQPGIERAALMKGLDMARGTFRHHLQKLVQADLVRDDDGCLTLPGIRPDPVEQARSHPTRAAVLDALLTEGRAPLKVLAQRSDIAPSLAHYHLKNLAEQGLVERRGRAWAMAIEA